MPTSPASLACVVLAHEDPVQVRRLVGALDPFPVVLHCPVGLPDDERRAMTEDLPDRVRVLEGSGHPGDAAAEAAGIRIALDTTDATHVAVLEGSDYPLADPDEVVRFLEDHRGRSLTGTHAHTALLGRADAETAAAGAARPSGPVEHSVWWTGSHDTGPQGPERLTIADAGRMLEHWTHEDPDRPTLFARGFSTATSSELLDLVDAAVGLGAHRRHEAVAP